MSKLSSYSSISSLQYDDLLPVVDVHDTTMASSGTTKKVTLGALGIGLWPSGDTTGATDYTNISGLLTLAGKCFLQAGTFYINNMLQLASATLLAGIVGATTIKAASGSWSGVTQVGSINGLGLVITSGNTTASNITIDGIIFDGNIAGVTAIPGWSVAVCCAPIHMNSVTGLKIRDCQVINAIGYSIYLQNDIRFWVNKCYVLAGQSSTWGQASGSPSQQDGIHIDGGSYGRILDNYVDTGTNAAVGDDAIALQTLSGAIDDVVVDGNMLRSGAHGVALAGAGFAMSNINVVNNDIWGSQAESVIVYQSTSTNTYTNISINDNECSGIGNNTAHTGFGVSIEVTFTSLTINDNNFTGFVNSQAFGIYIAGGSTTSTTLTVTGNTITGLAGFYVIYVGSSVSTAIQKFSITGNTGDVATSTGGNNPIGILLLNVQYGTCSGNTFTGNSDTNSVGLWVKGATAHVTVANNTCVNFGFGYVEATATGTPDHMTVSDNNLDGCSVPAVLTGFNDTISGNSAPGVGRITLATAFTSTTGTTAQNVTGMSTTLQAGSYHITAWIPLNPAGTTGSTQTMAFTFGGTATSGFSRWTMTGSASATASAANTLTTASVVSPTMTATGILAEFTGHVTVSVAGTLQLTVKSTTSGDEVTIPVGAFLDIQPTTA